MGNNVWIFENCRIEGVDNYEGDFFSPVITFGDGITVQQNLHLTCANNITIGRNTAIAANVTITDIHHPYDDIVIPIEKQKLKVAPVTIGEDCKIYNNAVILQGVTIGKHVTVAANSVVTKDIPDYCVVAGAPAKIVKQYNFEEKGWINHRNSLIINKLPPP
ncbi:hypothetical protein FACS189430_06110 [Bacteroidia bacterium]|nr:hypothetical protein FACS189430_06110 [Bacteroidia bacterium]